MPRLRSRYQETQGGTAEGREINVNAYSLAPHPRRKRQGFQVVGLFPLTIGRAKTSELVMLEIASFHKKEIPTATGIDKLTEQTTVIPENQLQPALNLEAGDVSK